MNKIRIKSKVGKVFKGPDSEQQNMLVNIFEERRFNPRGPRVETHKFQHIDPDRLKG